MPSLPFPSWVLRVGLVALVLGLVPVAFIARYRNIPSKVPRIHPIQDMDNQKRYKAQQANAAFADGRASRAFIPGTVAYRADATQRSMIVGDNDHMYRGVVGEGYAEAFPMALTDANLERGQRQYDIYCAPCHGYSGYGDGIVSRRAISLQMPNWVQPASLHESPYNEREVGHYFNTITNGIRNMPAYGRQISVEDRWAIVAYLKALQLSQTADVAQVPAAERSDIQQPIQR